MQLASVPKLLTCSGINLSACLLLWGAELAAVAGGFREEKSSPGVE